MKKKARHAEDRLISGKLRVKAGRAGAANTLVRVDDVDYAWEYRHGWTVWGKGVKAISVSVALSPGRTRELILDFTARVADTEGMPSELRMLRALEPAIRAAIDAGWDPESRGRAFRYEVGEWV